MPKHQPYTYRPLDDASTQIRILKVDQDLDLALTGADDDTERRLSGSLKTHSFPSTSQTARRKRVVGQIILPSYYALSYVWGPADLTHEIWLDGRPHRITRNLYLALRELRRYHIGRLYVWADAVCINQDDFPERSAQVLRMRDVYNSAFCVMIWLGPDSSEGRRCVSFLQKLTGYSGDGYEEGPTGKSERALAKTALVTVGPAADAALKLSQTVYALTDIMFQPAKDEKVEVIKDSSTDEKLVRYLANWQPKSKQLAKVEDEDFVEIAALIDRVILQQCTWFQRMWVVQEVGVGRVPSVLYCGVALNWDEVVKASYYLHYGLHAPISNIRTLVDLAVIQEGWTEARRLSLYDLIRKCRRKGSTDPRDKIYGLLGLMGDRLNILLQPDYTRSVAEVYALTTQHFILQNGSLDAICGWQTENRRRLPSWIPDYSLDQSRAASPLVHASGTTELFASSGHDSRSRYEIQSSPLQDWRRLPVTVLCLGSIVTVSPDAPSDADFWTIEQLWQATIRGASPILKVLKGLEDGVALVSSAIHEYSRYWQMAKSKRFVTSPSLDNSEQPLADVLAHHEGVKLEHDSFADIDRQFAEAYIHSLLCGKGVTAPRLTVRDVDAILKLVVPDSPLDPNDDPISQLCEEMDKVMSNRNIGITSKGDLCVLPQQARPNDVICTMFGCSVPVVLRRLPEPESYSFIGECYFYGFMDAEAIVLQIKGQLVEQRCFLV